MPRTLLTGAIALLVSLATPEARAEIYKYVDESGRVTYTNIPRKGAQTLGLEPRRSTMPEEKAKARGKAQATPADFPRVDAVTQRGRDSMRRRVLEDELRTEQRNLDEARAAMAQAGKGASVGRLADQLQLHQRNIEAIRKEIANLK